MKSQAVIGKDINESNMKEALQYEEGLFNEQILHFGRDLLRSFHLFLLLELAHVQVVIKALFCK